HYSIIEKKLSESDEVIKRINKPKSSFAEVRNLSQQIGTSDQGKYAYNQKFKGKIVNQINLKVSPLLRLSKKIRVSMVRNVSQLLLKLSIRTQKRIFCLLITI
ncbi:Unknown protein, partial [Striga hermonthica]